ncbi:ABC-2 type transport system permease protein [Arcticibacter tournemirensis]|uniref:ABC transporter permease n=1 Tax=Arcticibacter tournemirensis TaxID=699437 RepID=A0A5M9HAW2_9SPHI|nr:ABC transporter permease [Arcticibacter tournemirensis]KAA8484122.1 ABC transporter permease [Arcticibacter tournemirensis]TQM51865.1 ABC-2 type transport system permease protein [Arcticibacter tournemirensis]
MKQSSDSIFSSQFFSFVRKEFYHVMRDKKTLLILFGMPVMQILIFGFALTNEVKNSRIVVVDYARDLASQQITARIEASQYFDIEKTILDQKQIESAFKNGKIKLALIFPEKFNDELLHQNKAQIRVVADASDPNIANTLTNYVTLIVQDYQNELNKNISLPYRIDTEVRMLYNPQLKGAHSFVPGVMALVLMLVCVMMTAISIVREKETGTMEILLVSPFKPFLVILSKAVPYLILSLINVVSILLLSVFALDLPVNGSVLLLFAESTLFIITCLSLGIFISIKSATQQAAMTISLMGMMLPTIMFSGFMFPVENMPVPLQVISNIVPAKWFYIIAKSIMIKGLGITALWKETLILAGMTVFLLIISLKSFKIRLS